MNLKVLLVSFLALNSCGGGGSSSGSSQGFDGDCDGSCPEQSLSIEDTQKIIQQAITQSNRLGVSGTFSVVDRVGNILALYQMDGAVPNTLINGQIGAGGGLEGAQVPSILSAISKAGTGAYLSSQGNAFSTRTAGQIIQENFDPGENRQPSGPLFGVQFSQLICSDILEIDSSTAGPRPLPLGLSADPGGLPLYKAGSLVGGIGVEVNGVYTFDRNIRDIDTNENLVNIDENVAIAAAIGFEAPINRRADKIFVAGKSLRFTDVDYNEIEPFIDNLANLDVSKLVVAPPFSNGSIRAGATFGKAASGIANTIRAGVPASILVNSGGAVRFPTRAGTPLGGNELTSREVEALLDSTISKASKTRAAIRRPLDTNARVSIWIVDHLGTPLGFIRSQDAPIFGIDVALQKARTSVFFSSKDAAFKFDQLKNRENSSGFPIKDYINLARSQTYPSLFSDGTAFTTRAIANISRPYFPDGLEGNPPGSFSLAFPGTTGDARSWSPFNTGIQLDIILQRVLAPLSGQIPNTCTDINILGSRLGNGIQIFPGSNPLYRNGVLVGAIGVSGDGIDQDDFTSFYSSSREGLNEVNQTDIGDSILGFNSPKQIRSDNILFSSSQTRLRFINCPEAPFIGSNEQKICENL